MTSYNIAIIPGDGFGEESAREAVNAIKEAILR